MDTCPINVLSVCSGAGGLDLGLKLALPTARTVCYVEHEAFACEVLATRMEEKLLSEAPIWSDIGTFDGKPWRGIIQAIVGGYPCNPFSFTGKRRGKDDHRHLWPHIARIIGESAPSYCFFENVEGHLSLGFETVREELQSLGFRVEAGLFSAAEVGAPHFRKRLFILGCHERTFKAFGDDRNDVANAKSHAERLGLGQPEATAAGMESWPQGHGEDVADSESMRGSAVERGEQNGILQSMGQGIRATNGKSIPLFPPRPRDEEAWGGVIKSEPTVKPALCGMADELATGVDEREQSGRIGRLRLLGNGVVPACAALAFSVLLARMDK